MLALVGHPPDDGFDFVIGKTSWRNSMACLKGLLADMYIWAFISDVGTNPAGLRSI